MLPAVRRREIVALVSERGECSVADLAEEMGCSKATIRRDLDDLEDRQLIERSHGGAVPATTVGHEGPYGQQEVQNLEGKMLIGERAVEEIAENQVVFFDAGSTTMQVARNAPTDGSFVAVTNSPVLALELGERGADVKLTGGSLRREPRALVGPSAERFMRRTNFDLLFLGANAVDVDGGLTTSTEEEARLKELMIENASRVVLVADTTTLGERSFVRFAAHDDLDALITDGALTAAQRDPFEAANVEIVEEVDE